MSSFGFACLQFQTGSPIRLGPSSSSVLFPAVCSVPSPMLSDSLLNEWAPHMAAPLHPPMLCPPKVTSAEVADMILYVQNLQETSRGLLYRILGNPPVPNKGNRWSTCIYRDCWAWDIPASKQIVPDKSSWKVWKLWSQSVAGVDLVLGKHKPFFPWVLVYDCASFLWIRLSQGKVGQEGTFCRLHINPLEYFGPPRCSEAEFWNLPTT